MDDTVKSANNDLEGDNWHSPSLFGRSKKSSQPEFQKADQFDEKIQGSPSRFASPFSFLRRNKKDPQSDEGDNDDGEDDEEDDIEHKSSDN